MALAPYFSNFSRFEHPTFELTSLFLPISLATLAYTEINYFRVRSCSGPTASPTSSTLPRAMASSWFQNLVRSFWKVSRTIFNPRGGSIAQWLAYLLRYPSALSSITSDPKFNQRHCLEESGQWLENVDQTDLVQQSSLDPTGLAMLAISSKPNQT